MYGAVAFYKAAVAAGIRPIIGCEVYVAPRGMTDRVHGVDDAYTHLVLLCRDETGYHNLCYLVSAAFERGFYGKPRIDWPLLRAHAEGLICLSGCVAGDIPRAVLRGDYEAAKARAVELQELFGEGNFYLELQNHRMTDEARVRAALLRIHRETGIPLAATNDVHYIKKQDAYDQDVQYSEFKKWKETQISKDYHISWIPTSYLIDPEGKIAFSTLNAEEMLEKLDSLEAEL